MTQTDPNVAPEPEIHPSSTPEGPSTIPASMPGADPEPESRPDGTTHAPTQADQVNEELQLENAETSLDQPSDAAGSE